MADIFTWTDFRGGYFDNVPSEQLRDNELLQANNAVWDNGLKKRKGVAHYASMPNGGFIRGGIRAKIEGVWRTIIAVDEATTGGDAEFLIGTQTSFATLTYPDSTAHTITQGEDVQFAVLNDQVVAVNGSDEPRIIYATASTIYADTIERYDTRTVGDDNIFAGQYSSTTSSGNYGTNTSAAQSSASTSFEIQSTGTGTGFWVASDETFNFVTVKDAEATSSATLTFQYLGRASIGSSITWVATTQVDSPTWTSAGDKRIEFDIPQDPVTGDLLMETGPDSIGDPLTGRYCFRAVNQETSLTAALDAQGVGVQHSQYLSQILLNDKPDTVVEHINRIWLGAENWVRFSPWGGLKNWRFVDFEYFRSGGAIQQMVSQQDRLTVLSDDSIHAIFGTSLNNITVRRNIADVGAASKRGAVIANNIVYFVARDGIRLWDGSRAVLLSKHIQDTIDGLGTKFAAATYRKGLLWMSFPLDRTMLTFDPDTFRVDAEGDGRVSFYKHHGVVVDQFLTETGVSDDNTFPFLGINNTQLLEYAASNRTDVPAMVIGDATAPAPYVSGCSAERADPSEIGGYVGKYAWKCSYTGSAANTINIRPYAQANGVAGLPGDTYHVVGETYYVETWLNTPSENTGLASAANVFCAISDSDGTTFGNSAGLVSDEWGRSVARRTIGATTSHALFVFRTIAANINFATADISYFDASRVVMESGTELVRLDTGNVDEILGGTASATITMTAQTKNFFFNGSSHSRKIFRRTRVTVDDTTATGGEAYGFSLVSNDKDGPASTSADFSASVGTDRTQRLVGVPPTFTKENLGFFVSHDSHFDARLRGISVDVEERPYV